MMVKIETLVHAEPNEAPIEELFAFLSIDETGEGICAAILPEVGSTPLITSKARVAELMKDKAQEIASLAGKPVRLVRFTRADVVWKSRA
jgi:hypothetical protein